MGRGNRRACPARSPVIRAGICQGNDRHVCTSVSATLVAAAATAAQTTLNLRDGATGAGTILASWVLSVPGVIGSCAILPLDSLEIIGSPNTAMTLEFAAGVATQFESV